MAAKAMFILGKLGGRNRRFLKEPLKWVLCRLLGNRCLLSRSTPPACWRAVTSTKVAGHVRRKTS